ncbi:unnamed protein product [Prorocentrum cordatum]|uniref:DUF7869 domain-containing protein n=1 Tax=Prorocentrum cordatum TaxID=2364126 RepID=A0ABN9Y233_9DINO|nr:unnamed protein product [Polarella glacialis]
MPGRKSDTKKYEVDAYFVKLHRELGDTMPTPEKPDVSLSLDGEENALIEDVHVLCNLAIEVGGGKHAVPKRYLDPGIVESLWQGCKLDVPTLQQVSESTFKKRYNDAWKRILVHRNVGQGKRCTICSRLGEERALAVAEEAKAVVMNEKKKHIDSVMRDRAVNVRGNAIAEMNARNPTPHGLSPIIKVAVDGMDQAKFKTPRCAAGPGQTCNSRFKTVEMQFLQVGHAHAELDQLFAGVAAQISHAPRLEGIQEVADFIKSIVVPQRGRKLHVEVLNSIYDFRTWMTPFDMSIAGVVPTKTQPEAAHLWRFVPRSFIRLAGLTDAAVEITRPDWSDLEPNEQDTIILVKQFMADTNYCQQPVLLMPTQIASRLDPSDLQVAMPRVFEEGVVKQYRRAAEAVGAPPWNMLRGKAFLDGPCDAWS